MRPVRSPVIAAVSASRRDRIEQRARIANQAAQAIGVLAAGAWVMFVFWQQVVPFRADGVAASIQTKVEWNAVIGLCRAEVVLAIENPSERRRMDLLNVTVQLQSYDVSDQVANLADHLIPEPKNLLRAYGPYAVEPLAGQYFPKERRHEALVFYVPAERKQLHQVTFQLGSQSGRALVESCTKTSPEVRTR